MFKFSILPHLICLSLLRSYDNVVNSLIEEREPLNQHHSDACAFCHDKICNYEKAWKYLHHSAYTTQKKQVKVIKKPPIVIEHSRQLLLSLHILPIISPKDHSPLNPILDILLMLWMKMINVLRGMI